MIAGIYARKRITLGAVIAVMFIAVDAIAQVPFQPFSDLPTVLRPGQRVTVRDDTGRTSRGSITALTADRIELRWRSWRFQQRQRSFDESSVRTIAVVDSTWNGQLIGLGVGILVGWSMNAQCDNESCVGSALAGVVLAPAAGLFIGQAIDRSMNRLVYVARQNPSVTFAPLLTPTAVGIVARVRR
jgi:hypothetical protein